MAKFNVWWVIKGVNTVEAESREEARAKVRRMDDDELGLTTIELDITDIEETKD